MSEPLDEQNLAEEPADSTPLPAVEHVDGSEDGSDQASEHGDDNSESDLDDDDLRALEIDNGDGPTAAVNNTNDVSGNGK